MRAIPEKTLEHWSSMYLARRFPRCQLWWPSVGEDISVESLPNRPGKSLLLEVKTTDWSKSRWEHRLTIDVEQLRIYQRSPIPVYYVFPMPPWQGVLDEGHSWLAGKPRSSLINGGHGWFGDWLFVVRAETLWAWLGRRRSQDSATLFSNVGGSNDPATIWPDLGPWWPWSTFWGTMARCGSSEMPALFTVPAAGAGSSDSWQSRRTLVRRLARSVGESELRAERDLERFRPVEGEGYQQLAPWDFAEPTLTSEVLRPSTALLHLDIDDLEI